MGVQKIVAVEFGNGRERYIVGQPVPGIDIGSGIRVKEIGEHQPKGPGDVWMYGVTLEDGSSIRVFNQTRVFYSKPQAIESVKGPGLVGI